MSSPGQATPQDPAQAWNQRFDRPDFLFGAEPNRWLVSKRTALPPTGRVLCVADGEGRNSVWLARQGFEVHAFDISDVAVAKARQLAQSSGVDVRYEVASADAATCPPSHFDAAVAIFIQFADPAQRRRLFSRLLATLKPGGVLLLLGYTPRQLAYRTGGPSTLSHLYTEEQLREELKGLHFVELSAFDDDLREGSGHHGPSALIGVVGVVGIGTPA